jgi:predicted house-cleaning noncanonical NTP pyrophosphatase (MazG superfamily)
MSERKLVRDNIPDLIRADGLNPVIYTAAPDEYAARLRDKLREETAEFLAADALAGDDDDDGDSLQELADVLEVVYALAENIGAGRERLEAVRAAKAARDGAFAKRLVWSGNTTGTG